ncbi:xylem cysteine proteinase 2 [Panicum miliaceum]|uniref:Xylem cysteine proteinase 2 n=1 Tax=Panicum miliaceum TaxID=4540 RepID=A0A3L6RMJ5_PANMI|nr:xylem cysteine proteinase 2 [Panicum miliaceum]
MSLRSIGYLLLTRRFKIYRVSSLGIAASVSAAGRPGHRAHVYQRDLGAGDNYAFGSVVAAALAGGLGILILKKHPGTYEDTKESSRKTDDMEKHDVEAARFREWMKREGKVYPKQEEERKRFEVFKETVNKMDALYEKSSVRYLPESPWADMTYEEIMEMRGYNKRVNYDQYLEEEKDMTRMMKFLDPAISDLERAQNLMEEGKLKKHNRSLLFPEKQEREQKMKEEGSLHNCSKQ